MYANGDRYLSPQNGTSSRASTALNPGHGIMGDVVQASFFFHKLHYGIEPMESASLGSKPRGILGTSMEKAL